MRAWWLLGLWLGFAGPAGAGAQEPVPDVVVLCATSTAEALRAVGDAFEATGGPHVVLAAGASSALTRQLLAGATGDLFLSADDAQMDRVAALIDPTSRFELVGNRLVVVAGEKVATRIQRPSDLRELSRIAVADPRGVPAGVYARRWLERLRLWKDLEPKVVPTLDVAAALRAAEVGGAQAAIVYRTDARRASNTHVVLEAQRSDAPNIVYPVARLRRAGPSAPRFLEFLLGATGRYELEKRGFLWLGRKAR